MTTSPDSEAEYSSINETDIIITTSLKIPEPSDQNSSLIIIGCSVGSLLLILLIVIPVVVIKARAERRKRREMKPKQMLPTMESLETRINSIKQTVPNIHRATNNYSSENLIEERPRDTGGSNASSTLPPTSSRNTPQYSAGSTHTLTTGARRDRDEFAPYIPMGQSSLCRPGPVKKTKSRNKSQPLSNSAMLTTSSVANKDGTSGIGDKEYRKTSDPCVQTRPPMHLPLDQEPYRGHKDRQSQPTNKATRTPSEKSLESLQKYKNNCYSTNLQLDPITSDRSSVETGSEVSGKKSSGKANYQNVENDAEIQMMRQKRMGATTPTETATSPTSPQTTYDMFTSPLVTVVPPPTSGGMGSALPNPPAPHGLPRSSPGYVNAPTPSRTPSNLPSRSTESLIGREGVQGSAGTPGRLVPNPPNFLPPSPKSPRASRPPSSATGGSGRSDKGRRVGYGVVHKNEVEGRRPFGTLPR